MSVNLKHLYICTNCHYSGMAAKRGSGGIELILWLCYIVPGLLYTIWRGGGTRCPKCGNTNMIPATTPKGQEILAGTAANVLKTTPETTADQNSFGSRLQPALIVIGQYILFTVLTISAFGAMGERAWLRGLCMMVSGLLLLPPLRKKYLVNTPLEKGFPTFSAVLLLTMLGAYGSLIGNKAPAENQQASTQQRQQTEKGKAVAVQPKAQVAETPEEKEEELKKFCIEMIKISANHPSTLDIHTFSGYGSKVLDNGTLLETLTFSAKNSFGLEESFQAICTQGVKGNPRIKISESSE